MSALSVAHMKQAAERVQEVQGQSYQKIYGGLCHAFPVMVRQCGLAQAIAFSLAKSEDKNADRKAAHGRVLEDFKALTERDAAEVVDLGLMEYVVATRRVLSAWVYYKRFAVSILNVESSQDAEEENP